jgi:hypothetical protein
LLPAMGRVDTPKSICYDSVMSSTTTRTDASIGRDTGRISPPKFRKRPATPRLRPADLFWILTFGVTPLLLGLLPQFQAKSVERSWLPFLNHHAVQVGMSAVAYSLISPTAYIGLLRNRDKSPAVIAGALCALSLYSIYYCDLLPITAVATLLLVAASSFILLDLPQIGFGLLAVAAILWPEASVFAIVFFVFRIKQNPKNAPLSAVIYVILCAGFLIAAKYLIKPGVFPPVHVELLRYAQALSSPALFSSAIAAIWWFIFPFLGELTVQDSRRKYLPIAVAVLLYIAVLGPLRLSFNAQALLPIMPFTYMIAGVGIARLIPSIAGDIRGVAIRYAVAIIAVLSVIAVTFAMEWYQLSHLPVLRPNAVRQQILSAVPITAPAAKSLQTGQANSAKSPTARLVYQKLITASAVISKFKKQGEDFNESRSNGWRRGNTTAPAHLKPSKAASTHPQQTVHAALDRATQAVWRRRNYSYSLLPGG